MSQFDTAKKDIPVSVNSGGQKKLATVRFPVDSEWSERQRKLQTIKHTLGRGKSEYMPARTEITDLELFNKIRTDTNGTEFDGFEASKIIGKLEASEVTSIEATGDGYEVHLKAMGVETLHVLKAPTQAQIVQYRRAYVKVTDERRTQNIRFNLDPAAQLYSSLKVRVEGYTEAVPIIHQAAVITEVDSELDSGEDELTFSF